MEIFVFGSNYEGRHTKGGAHYALKKRGAIYGIGEGRQGESYGIPTKGYNLMVLSLDKIKGHVEKFMEYATKNPGLLFKVTTIGTGLAGYSHDDIAPLFIGSPKNCIFDDRWKLILGNGYNYFKWNGKQ